MQFLSPCIRIYFGGLVRKDSFNSSVQINLLARNNPRVVTMHDAMTKVNNQEDRDAYISSQETARVPVLGEENVEAVDEREDDERYESNVCTNGLKEGVVRDILLVEALNLGGFAESKIGDRTADPGDKAGGVGQIDEPVEDYGTAAGAVEVGKWAEERGSNNGHVWDTTLSAFSEDLGCVTSDCERVERARRHVEE